MNGTNHLFTLLEGLRDDELVTLSRVRCEYPDIDLSYFEGRAFQAEHTLALARAQSLREIGKPASPLNQDELTRV